MHILATSSDNEITENITKNKILCLKPLQLMTLTSYLVICQLFPHFAGTLFQNSKKILGYLYTFAHIWYIHVPGKHKEVCSHHKKLVVKTYNKRHQLLNRVLTAWHAATKL